MKKLFNQLYSNELEFKKEYDKKKKIKLVLEDEEQVIYSIKGSKKIRVCLETYDWFIGDETPISLEFSKVF